MGQEEGAREEEMMSGGRQWKAATNTASGPGDETIPNIQTWLCAPASNKLSTETKHFSHLCSDFMIRGWFTQMHLKPSIISFLR